MARARIGQGFKVTGPIDPKCDSADNARSESRPQTSIGGMRVEAEAGDPSHVDLSKGRSRSPAVPA
jgi:hypothetical protein